MKKSLLLTLLLSISMLIIANFGFSADLINTSFEDADGWVNQVTGEWTQVAIDGTWTANAYANGGDAYAGTRKVGLNATDRYLITPSKNQPKVISFWATKSSTSASWTVEVQKRVSAGSWTNIGTITAGDIPWSETVVGSYKQFSFNVNESNNNVEVQWIMTARTGGSIYIDNVILSDEGSVPEPTATPTPSPTPPPVSGITNISVLNQRDSNGGAVNKGTTYTINGIVISPNLDPASLLFYVQDSTGGIQVYKNASAAWYNNKSLAMGSDVTITGAVDLYNGAVEIIPVAETDITNNGTGSLPAPQQITIDNLQDLTAADQVRYNQVGKRIRISNIHSTGAAAWPNFNADANAFMIAVGSPSSTPTGIMRIDKDTDIPGTTEPIWPQNVIGIGTQFDSASPYFSGFQISPIRMSDFEAYADVDTWNLY